MRRDKTIRSTYQTVTVNDIIFRIGTKTQEGVITGFKDINGVILTTINGRDHHINNLIIPPWNYIREIPFKLYFSPENDANLMIRKSGADDDTYFVITESYGKSNMGKKTSTEIKEKYGVEIKEKYGVEIKQK